jgi:hypothetical protein
MIIHYIYRLQKSSLFLFSPHNKSFSFVLSSTMGKTKGSKNITVRDKLTNSPHPPAVQYDRLPPIDRLITYYYYIYILSEGQLGWDIEKSGFKEHWAQFEALQEIYSSTQFYTRGKVSRLNWVGLIQFICY